MWYFTQNDSIAEPKWNEVSGVEKVRLCLKTLHCSQTFNSCLPALHCHYPISWYQKFNRHNVGFWSNSVAVLHSQRLVDERRPSDHLKCSENKGGFWTIIREEKCKQICDLNHTFSLWEGMLAALRRLNNATVLFTVLIFVLLHIFLKFFSLLHSNSPCLQSYNVLRIVCTENCVNK